MGFVIANVHSEGSMIGRCGISLIASAALGACISSDAARSVATVSDSSGITIIENHGPYQEWQLAPSPDLRIGTVEGDSSYQFYRVQFAGRLSDGRIVVADGSRQIRWYDPEGIYRSTVGRQGEGPGEFGLIGDVLVTPSDTVVVHDRRNRRATWLSPQGEYVREVTLRELPSGRLTLLALTSDNRLAVSTSGVVYDALRPDVTYMRDTLTVLRASPGQLDTVARVAGRETALWALFSGGTPSRMMEIGLPFAHTVVAAATADHFSLADGVAHEIRFYDWTGVITRIARRPEVAGIVLSDAEKDRYLADLADRMQAARQAGSTDPSGEEQAARDALAALPDGHTVPSFDALLSDVDGRIWLRDFVSGRRGDAESKWTVFGLDGVVERRVVTPPGLQVMHVGSEYVTGVERDSLDVEYVVVYRLEPGS